MSSSVAPCLASSVASVSLGLPCGVGSGNGTLRRSLTVISHHSCGSVRPRTWAPSRWTRRELLRTFFPPVVAVVFQRSPNGNPSALLQALHLRLELLERQACGSRFLGGEPRTVGDCVDLIDVLREEVPGHRVVLAPRDDAGARGVVSGKDNSMPADDLLRARGDLPDRWRRRSRWHDVLRNVEPYVRDAAVDDCSFDVVDVARINLDERRDLVSRLSL